MSPILRSLSIVLALAAAGAHAAPEEKQYLIEAVVFEQHNASLSEDEAWNPPQPNANLPQAQTPEDGLAPDSKLAPNVANLEKDPNYRVLALRHWTQAGGERNTTKPMRIQAGELDGTIQFYVSRFLHADVDLTLGGGTDANGPVRYALSEQRRLKSLETNYFDHPKFGVLLRVTPVKTTTPGKKPG